MTLPDQGRRRINVSIRMTIEFVRPWTKRGQYSPRLRAGGPIVIFEPVVVFARGLPVGFVYWHRSASTCPHPFRIHQLSYGLC